MYWAAERRGSPSDAAAAHKVPGVGRRYPDRGGIETALERTDDIVAIAVEAGLEVLDLPPLFVRSPRRRQSRWLMVSCPAMPAPGQIG